MGKECLQGKEEEMSKSEGNVQNEGRMMASKYGAVTFRNNVGSATAGKVVRRYTKDGKRYSVVENPRHIDFGLVEGSGDTIGWKSVKITADMVGKAIAQFVSIEYKTTKGRPSKAQLIWHDNVSRAGGLTGFARCDDDVSRILSGEKVDP